MQNDCGLEIAESPALRGLVGGLRSLATAALYLVLKSNGLHRPKIRLKKFSFSLKIVPAYISTKSYRHNAVSNRFSSRFSTSPTNGPRSLSHLKVGVHTRLCSKNRTQRLTRRNRGAFRMGVVSLPSDCSARSQTSPGRVSERRTLPLWGLGQVYS